MSDSESAIPDVIEGVDVQSAGEALSMLMCPWRLQVGICATGCWEEPACQTSEPREGWAGQLRAAVAYDGTLWTVGEECAQRIERDGFVSAGPCQEPEARHIGFGEKTYHVIIEGRR